MLYLKSLTLKAAFVYPIHILIFPYEKKIIQGDLQSQLIAAIQRDLHKIPNSFAQLLANST